jgi:iron(III) transport system ATP-binding protein
MRVELRALQQRLGITTVYVTHDQEEAMVLSDLIAVMDGGRLQQVATPERIYLRPATRTVAAFFGMPNLLEAKVRTVDPVDDETVVVRVDGDGWAGRAWAPRGTAAGDAVSVLVRPEAVQVGRAAVATGEGIAFTGRVRQTFFRGSRRMLTVQAGSLVLNVDAPFDVAAAPGTTVWLRVDAPRAWVVPQ